jgi:hypothetical protein
MLSHLRLSIADAAELVQEPVVVQKKAFVALTRKFSKFNVIPLDLIKIPSKKSRTPTNFVKTSRGILQGQ